MTTEEKLVQGLRLIVEAFAEMIKENKDNSKIQDNSEQTQSSENKTFKIKHAAEYLGVSPYRIWVEVKKGNIEHFKAGNRILIRKSALEKWVRQQEENSIKRHKPDTKY